MFIVTCDAGYNIFVLADHGWTANRDNAAMFATRSAAAEAAARAYRARGDVITIGPA